MSGRPRGGAPRPAAGGGRTPRAPDGEARDRGPGGMASDGGLDEPPPVLGRWSRLYALVVLELLAIIAALGWLTRRFD